MTLATVVVCLYALAALANVAANLDRNRFFAAVAVTKPLLMPLLVLFHLMSAIRVNGMLVAALTFGFVGDMLLLVPGERKRWFLGGLLSFLLNLLVYAVIFWKSGCDPRAILSDPWLALACVAFLAYGVLFFRKIRPGLGKLQIPVAAYVATILVMAVSALLRAPCVSGPAFWLVLLGSVSFVASDSVLAYDRFRARLRYGQSWTMATYTAAQVLIVLGLSE